MQRTLSTQVWGPNQCESASETCGGSCRSPRPSSSSRNRTRTRLSTHHPRGSLTDGSPPGPACLVISREQVAKPHDPLMSWQLRRPTASLDQKESPSPRTALCAPSPTGSSWRGSLRVRCSGGSIAATRWAYCACRHPVLHW